MAANRMALPFVVLTVLLQGTAPAAPIEAPMLLQISRSSQLRFRIVSGRIDVGGTNLRHSSRSSSSSGARRESLAISQNGFHAKLDYDRTTSEEQLSLEIETGGIFSLSYRGKNGSSVVPIQFEQRPGEAVVLTLGAEGQQRRIEAAGVWHLLLAEPEDCRKHLLPILKLLRPDWKLDEAIPALEQELLQIASRDGSSLRARWAELVEQLADERFAKRQAADRALRAEGGAVLGYLSGLDFGQLDAEQHYRIRRIIRSLTPRDGDDQPGSVAAQLSGDPVVWLGLLTRPSESTRRAAANQLAEILGKPIQFDPAAEADVRAAQVARLRQEIEGR